MRVLLRDLTPGQDYAIQFRSNTGETTSEWSQVQHFTTTNDTIRPGNVKNLSWYDSGSAFIGEWDKVVVDEMGNELRDFRFYRCNVSDGTVGQDFFVVDERFELTKEMNTATFGTLKTALTLSVWAVDLSYNESITAARIAVNPLNPGTPSKPVVSQYLGLLTVTWDGKDAAGAAMAGNVDYAEVHVSKTNAFTPTTATYAGRVYRDGSANKVTLPDLEVGDTYYVRLVAVNLLLRHSGPSAQAQGTPGRITGLDIQNGQISVDQINFTAKDIGGANAFYSTSFPASGMKEGDVLYDTDDQYKTYRYTGGNWIAAPEIGVVTGSKIIAGTVTADAIGTNLLITNRANIADAVIDSAHIRELNAGKITTGSISADQRIIAGPEEDNHAEMTSTGFYVRGPQPGGDPLLPPIIVDRIRMGTGVSDFFAIPDPLHPDTTLAQISEDGIGSFQNLYVNGDPTIQGRKFSDWIGELNTKAAGRTVGRGWIPNIYGLNQSGAMGIRDAEYGIGQFSFEVEYGRTYRIFSQLRSWYITNGGEVSYRVRYQQDYRTAADRAAGVPPTPVTINSPLLMDKEFSGLVNNWRQSPQVETWVYPDWTGTVSIGLSMALGGAPPSDSVIKVVDNSVLDFTAIDCGPSVPTNGRFHNEGGSLYSWTAPLPPAPPPPAPVPQQYYWEGGFDWVASYKGDGSYMSNTNGRGYQGQDPGGYNGNQFSLFGFSYVDWAALTAGAHIDRIVVYLYFAHWYYNAGGTARIGWTSAWGNPGSAGAPFGIADTFDVGGWPKPGGLDIDITGFAPWFQNGRAHGIGLGPGNNGYQNYGFATDCRVKIWYTK